MKKFITIMLIAIMALLLCACRVDNTEDNNTNKGSQDTVENTINLDDCYVCYVYFGNSTYCGQASDWRLGDRWQSTYRDIIGCYIRGDVIFCYQLARIWYMGSRDDIGKEHRIEHINRLYREYHGIESYYLSVISVEYLNENNRFEDKKDIWTWGELKQIISAYNSISRV